MKTVPYENKRRCGYGRYFGDEPVLATKGGMINVYIKHLQRTPNKLFKQ